MDPMLVNMKNDILPLISVIILPKVLTLYHPVHIETLAAIYWKSFVALNFQREKSVDVSQLYKIMEAM